MAQLTERAHTELRRLLTEHFARPRQGVRLRLNQDGGLAMTIDVPLATALHGAGHEIMVCNPLSIARYSQAVLARTKTDATDARGIDRFGEVHDVPPWAPASPAQQHLRALLTARETLVQERLRLGNRQHVAGYTANLALVTELQAPVAGRRRGPARPYRWRTGRAGCCRNTPRRTAAPAQETSLAWGSLP